MPPGSRKPAAPRTVPAASLATVFKPSVAFWWGLFCPFLQRRVDVRFDLGYFFFIIKEMSSPLFWSTWTVSVLVAKLTEHASIPFIPAISCSIFVRNCCSQGRLACTPVSPFPSLSPFFFSAGLYFIYEHIRIYYLPLLYASSEKCVNRSLLSYAPAVSVFTLIRVCENSAGILEAMPKYT